MVRDLQAIGAASFISTGSGTIPLLDGFPFVEKAIRFAKLSNDLLGRVSISLHLKVSSRPQGANGLSYHMEQKMGSTPVRFEENCGSPQGAKVRTGVGVRTLRECGGPQS